MDGRIETLCPSSDCHPGARVIGVVLPDGHVACTAAGLVVDDEFDRIARQGRPPERRFRFSDMCMRGACRQWTGERCGLIDRLMRTLTSAPSPNEDLTGLNECSIRDECRWFRQHGASACGVCEGVVTDTTERGAELPPRVRHARSDA